MLPVEEALDRILALCDVLPPQTQPIDEALGQVLADDVVAPFDIPPLDNTAMDGYAVQAADTRNADSDRPVRLRVGGELAAGYLYDGEVGPGEAVRIMTGAPIPDGADAIVPFEETDETLRDGIRAPGQQHAAIADVGILKAANPGANVRRRGEDVRAGATILTRGTLLRGAEIAVLASLGVDRASVIRRPIVAILSTGDELLAPGEPLQPGKIYDSNAPGLAALVREYGGVPLRLGIAADTVEALTAKIHEATRQADLVVTSAGVSRGDFDVVKEVLVSEGAINFWTVRMKPGKPLAFGSFAAPAGHAGSADRASPPTPRDAAPSDSQDGSGGTKVMVKNIPHIGLPGNPVSSLLAFELFGRPAIFKMLGRTPEARPTVRAIADEPIVNTDGRRVYARATVARGEDGRWHARLTGPQGSGVLTSLARANGLAICPEDADRVDAGQECDVIMLDWEQPQD